TSYYRTVRLTPHFARVSDSGSNASLNAKKKEGQRAERLGSSSPTPETKNWAAFSQRSIGCGSNRRRPGRHFPTHRARNWPRSRRNLILIVHAHSPPDRHRTRPRACRPAAHEIFPHSERRNNRR